MGNNDVLRIVEKLRKSANDVLVALQNKIKYFDHIYELKEELSEVEDLETLCCFSSKEIIEILGTIAPSYKVDANNLEASLYFYSIGKEKENVVAITAAMADGTAPHQYRTTV